jgi:uncharacterized protein (TIGR00297 family)
MSGDTPTPAIEPVPWTLRKAIPEARDRLQSRMLVWVGLPVLCYLNVSLLLRITPFSGRLIPALGRYDDFLKMTLAVSIFFAIAAWRLRAATPFAAVCGGLICLQITGFSEAFPGASVVNSNLTPLILLFVLTFEATRLGRARKVVAGLAEHRKGRDAAQIIANLGIAAWYSSFQFYYPVAWFYARVGSYQGSHPGRYLGIYLLPVLAALAEATADTVSSEIGQAFGGRPFLLATLRRVEPGTDGAISLLGTLAGSAAAAIVAFSVVPAIDMSYAECGVAFAAGIAGLFFDSLLGATIERKGWIGNDLVNFSSTAFAALVSLVAIRFLSYRLLF